MTQNKTLTKRLQILAEQTPSNAFYEVDITPVEAKRILRIAEDFDKLQQNGWRDVNKERPQAMTEVLVWIDGHRGPSWKNNHALVAYMNHNGEWFEERHRRTNPLVGVKAWMPIVDFN